MPKLPQQSGIAGLNSTRIYNFNSCCQTVSPKGLFQFTCSAERSECCFYTSLPTQGADECLILANLIRGSGMLVLV